MAPHHPAVSPAWPAGHQHYYDSDYTVHRRPGWFASIKMFSARTKSGERTNDENILGSRQSDGRFYLVLDGDEYFGSNVWPAFDWTRLPGITVEQKSDAANDIYGFGMADPVRLEFWGDEIVDLRQFEIASQRSTYVVSRSLAAA